MNYFKMPNNIFAYDLTATELSVLAVLYAKGIHTQKGFCAYIKQSTIAKTLNIKSTKTIANAIKNLSNKSLIITVNRRRKSNGLLGTYSYTLPTATTDKYFKVKRNFFKFKLSTVQMRMYLFIAKCIDVRLEKCWNSYNDIASKLNIARSSAIKTIRELIKLKALFCLKVKNKDNSYSDNHYSFEPFIKVKMKIKRAITLPMLSPSTKKEQKIFNYNIKLIITICQFIFFKVKNSLFIYIRGSTIFYLCIYKTHLKTFTIKKKNNIYT